MGDLWCVILAGGVGSRFWPVSTAHRPKQLLPLASDQPLLCDALDRDVVNIHLVHLDEVEQQIERTLEDFELHFVFVGGHRAVRLTALAGMGSGECERANPKGIASSSPKVASNELTLGHRF